MKEMPKLVVRRLMTQQVVVDHQVHPDPNLLGAYGEGLLSPGERLQIVEHLAICSLCRNVTMLSLPATNVNAGPAVSFTGIWLFPRLRWSAALACVAIVGVGLSLTFRNHREAGIEMASNSAPSSQFSPRDAAAGAANTTTHAQPANPSNKSSVEKRQVEGASDASAKESQASATKLLSAQSSAAASGGASAHATEMRQSFASGSNELAPMLAARIVVPTAPLWTLTADGGLQRSLDGGKNWASVSIAPRVHFLAVSAVQLDVWVVGMSGAVYHSTDAGQNWHQVKPVAGDELLSSDVTGVQFADSAHGELTTGSGTWLTDDGGETWRKK